MVKLGAVVSKVPDPDELPTLVAKIARFWAELHEANPSLALEVARGLPLMKITRKSDLSV